MATLSATYVRCACSLLYNAAVPIAVQPPVPSPRCPSVWMQSGWRLVRQKWRMAAAQRRRVGAYLLQAWHRRRARRWPVRGVNRAGRFIRCRSSASCLRAIACAARGVFDRLLEFAIWCACWEACAAFLLRTAAAARSAWIWFYICGGAYRAHRFLRRLQRVCGCCCHVCRFPYRLLVCWRALSEIRTVW